MVSSLSPLASSHPSAHMLLAGGGKDDHVALASPRERDLALVWAQTHRLDFAGILVAPHHAKTLRVDERDEPGGRRLAQCLSSCVHPG
jgi:hypothetical protein